MLRLRASRVLSGIRLYGLELRGLNRIGTVAVMTSCTMGLMIVQLPNPVIQILRIVYQLVVAQSSRHCSTTSRRLR